MNFYLFQGAAFLEAGEEGPFNSTAEYRASGMLPSPGSGLERPQAASFPVPSAGGKATILSNTRNLRTWCLCVHMKVPLRLWCCSSKMT